ncbi:MAG: polysaccharide biosynthesis tyrosine autokinase, partial [Candidatus Rokubacteria bacterium]|nr:polysaccharide biosynthesis tyrosine autokinase [Candidatus Rokubacteria bacterium]
MAQYEMNLRDYWMVVRRRRLVILGSVLLVVLFSIVFAQRRTPEYEATAAVKYEQSSSLSGLLVEVLSYSTSDSIETQATLIKSSPVLEEVARRLGRLPQTSAGGAVRESPAYMAALNSLAARIKTSRVPSTSIIDITVKSTSAAEARDLANTVAEAYRDYSRNQRNARIVEARKFIESQLKEVEARVRAAEEDLRAFREQNRIISPGGESSVLQALFTQARTDLEKTRVQRAELEQAQARLAQPAGGGINDRVFVDASGNAALQRLQSTEMELLLERNNLALEVTDKHPRLQAVDDRIREIRAEMRREVTAQAALLRRREEALERQMAEVVQQNKTVPGIELGLQQRQRETKVNDDLLTLLKTKHQEALIKEAESVEEVTIVRPATEPPAPVGGETLNTVVVGALLGLLLGLVGAFVLETLDTSIGTIEDVETYLGVPVLGIVPHIDAKETVARLIERRPRLAQLEPEAMQSHALLITHFDPKSPVAEAYRTLRTNIQFMRAETGGKVLVVTSPTLQEGKTTTIVNLALTMAQNGQRTLLVGGNLRRPSIHRFFGIERGPGLSEVLVGNARWRDCIRTVNDILLGRFEMEDIMASPGLDNLHIIEAGAVPANPSELLSTPAMTEFLREVRDAYDIVLIDTPPVLPVTDSAVIAGQVDGVVLVYQAGKVGRLVLKRAKIQLESARGKLWGVVLNDVRAEITGYAYAHQYSHYYGEEAPAGPQEGPVSRALAHLCGRGRPEGPGEPTRERGAPEAPRSPLPGRRRGGYQNVRWAILLVAALVALLIAAFVWSAGWLSAPPRPRELLRQRPETPAAAPASPATPTPRPQAPPGALPTAPPQAPPRAEPPPAGTAPSRAPAAPAPPQPGAPGSAAAPPSRPGESPTAPASARFAVEFGPFFAAADAERVERQLSQGGYQTVRFRQQTGGTLYAVLIERLASARDAQLLVATL